MKDNQTPHLDKHHKPNYFSSTKPLVIFLGLVAICGLSFYGGITYQKSKNTTDHAAISTRMMGAGPMGQYGSGSGRAFNGQRPIRGQVTAISSTSITVTDNFSGSSSTHTITSGTKITNNGNTASASDIKTGDTVVIIASAANSNQATQILINPTFGRGGLNHNNSTGTPTPTQIQ